MSDSVTLEVSFRDHVPSGPGRALLRLPYKLLDNIDRAATILRMSREQYMRNTMRDVSEYIIALTEESQPEGVVKQDEPVDRRSAAKLDPSKPPGM